MTVMARIDVSVRPQNADAFESWWAGAGPMMRSHKGFQFAALGNSPGDPGSFTWVGRFSDSDALQS